MSFELFKAFVVGVVEGLTEFLPVSSTGHLLLVQHFFGFDDDDFGKTFAVLIQFGAILAVCWEFRVRLVRTVAGLAHDPTAQRFALNLIVAFVPAAVLGLLLGKAIKRYLFAPLPVALAFIVGAFVILWVEHWRRRVPSSVRIDDVDAMRWPDALKVGVAQAFALIPGTSRSGATIIGGMLFGLSREAATRFSFFLAIPTLLAACIYDFLRNRALFSTGDLQGLAIGFVAAFIAAILCVRWLLRYVSRHDFIPFAWYRIAFGIVILVTAWMRVVDWS